MTRLKKKFHFDLDKKIDNIIQRGRKKNLLSIFHFFCTLCILIALSIDTNDYLSMQYDLLFKLNIVTVVIIFISSILFITKHLALETSSLVTVYATVTNMMITNIIFIYGDVENWESNVFRDTHFFNLCLIFAGLININRHIYILSFFYVVYISFIIFLSYQFSGNEYFIHNLYLLFFSVFGMSILGLVYIKVYKQINEHRVLLQKNIARQNQELLEKENELIKERTSHLEDIVHQKNKELTTNAMLLAQNNQINERTIQKVKEIQNYLQTNPNQKISEMISGIAGHNNSGYWDEFQKRFEDVHQQFYTTITKRFSSLSPAELRLAAFVKLGLSTKEISALTQNTKESVDVARSRLRKKLGIDKSINLVTFLNEL